jgi:hypothetical protein
MRKTHSTKNGYIVSFYQTPVDWPLTRRLMRNTAPSHPQPVPMRRLTAEAEETHLILDA